MDFALPADLVRFQEHVRQFVCEKLQPIDAEVESNGQVPETALAGLRRMGLFGTNTPVEYGGLGLSMLGSCLAIEELAKAHIAFYFLSGVNVHIGSKPIEFAGSGALKRRWLPELASGRIIAAFALTEAEAGSDAAAIRTTARRDGDHYVLDGAKIGAGTLVAAGSLVAPGTEIPDGVLAAGSPAQVKKPIEGTGAAFWVETNAPYYADLARRHAASIKPVD